MGGSVVELGASEGDLGGGARTHSYQAGGLGGDPGWGSGLPDGLGQPLTRPPGGPANRG